MFPMIPTPSELPPTRESSAGLTKAQLLALLRLKRKVQLGECNELTLEYKRLLFARHLYCQGRLQG